MDILNFTEPLLDADRRQPIVTHTGDELTEGDRVRWFVITGVWAEGVVEKIETFRPWYSPAGYSDLLLVRFLNGRTSQAYAGAVRLQYPGAEDAPSNDAPFSEGRRHPWCTPQEET